MKVYQFVGEPSKMENPYVRTLIDGINSLHDDVEWISGREKFWSDEIISCDIMHIHWPNIIVKKSFSPDIVQRFQNRIKQIKNHGVKIVVTCHNLEPHYNNNEKDSESYRIVWDNADLFIHLGEYSRKVLASKYVNAKHVIIPHHTYDSLYRREERDVSISKLGLNPEYTYILCFGAFRSEEERNLVKMVSEKFYDEGVAVLAPNFVKIKRRKNCFALLKQVLYWLYLKKRYPGIIISGRYVSDDDLVYYFGASAITLIQRYKILNSGNMPLAFLMGNVVVGPNVGNVGDILNKTGNPIFNVYDKDSLFEAISKGLKLSKEGKGSLNAKYANDQWRTEIIAEKLYQAYCNLISNNEY